MSDSYDEDRKASRRRSAGWWFYAGSAAAALLIVLVLVVLMLRHEARISRGNYALVRIGMSEADACDVLGTPGHAELQLGIVAGPHEYGTNRTYPPARLRTLGYKDYRFRQWTGPDLTIVVICDTTGVVAAKYCRDGQNLTWFSRIRKVMKGIH